MSASPVTDTPPSQTLYHYTSTTGLIGIFKSKALFASHISYLNDEAELRHAIEVFDRRAAQLLDGAHGARHKCLTQLREWLQHGFVFQHLLFVCSFTTKGNLLSQWRGYCPPGRGVSLGFNPDELVTTADSQGFYVSKCRYAHAEQLEILEAVLQSILVTAEDSGEAPPSRRHPTQSYYDVFEKFEDNLIRTAALIKHPSFEEEDEWRAISRVGKDLRDPSVHFRDGPLGLVPFVEFRLPITPAGSLSVEHAFVGPSSHPNLAFMSIDVFFHRNGGIPKRGLYASGVPLRSS